MLTGGIWILRETTFFVFVTRWAPKSYKWSYNNYKWPDKWVTGAITLLIGVITPLITGRGPPCRSFRKPKGAKGIRQPEGIGRDLDPFCCLFGGDVSEHVVFLSKLCDSTFLKGSCESQYQRTKTKND